MAFQFRLESVLTLKKNEEEQIQLKLAREQMMLQHHHLRLAGLQEDRNRLGDLMEERKKKPVPTNLFLYYMEAMRVQVLQIHILKNTIAAQGKVVESVREELARATRARKTIELLRDKELARYLAETRRKEQKESDEQALLRHGREVLV